MSAGSKYLARLYCGNFDPATSDVDFLVVFKPLDPAAHAQAYLGLLGDLQDLFLRDVDLMETEAVRNPFFLQSMAEHRAVLYAA